MKFPNTQKYLLYAPCYVFGASMGLGMFLAMALVLRNMNWEFMISYVLVGVDCLVLAGVFFCIRRGFALIEVSPVELRIVLPFRLKNFILRAGEAATLHVERRSDYDLQTVVIEKQSPLAKFLKGLFFRRFHSMEEFVVITRGDREKLILPNTYRWNQRGFSKIKNWLLANQTPHTVAEGFLWDDPRVMRMGMLYLRLIAALVLVFFAIGIYLRVKGLF